MTSSATTTCSCTVTKFERQENPDCPVHRRDRVKVAILVCDYADRSHGVATVPLRSIDVTTSGSTDVRCRECGGPMVLDHVELREQPLRVELIERLPRRCPDCAAVLSLGPPHRCFYPGLVLLLETRGVELDEQDRRMLRWISGFDQPTVGWLKSVIARVRGEP